jgi:SAM-dependent methyltransferase
MPAEDPRRHAPATLRNREPILAVLQDVLPPAGLLLEIASGSGEHAAFMARHLPATLVWQPTDADATALAGIDAHAAASAASNLRPALHLDVTNTTWPVESADAVFAANLVHIASWPVAEGLFAGAGRLLRSGGLLILYGPFKRHRQHTAASNEAFDRTLRAQRPGWGVRCLDTDLDPLAQKHGLARVRVVQMPANNLTVIWRRS